MSAGIKRLGTLAVAMLVAAVSSLAPGPMTVHAAQLGYTGGPVIINPHVYIDYWGPEWSSTTADANGYTPAQVKNYVQSFLQHLGGSPSLSVLTQYFQYPLGGVKTFITNPTVQFNPATDIYADSRSVPSPFYRSDIKFEAAVNADGHFHASTDYDRVYLILTGPGKNPQDLTQPPDTKDCAYHDWTQSGGHRIAFAYVPWWQSISDNCFVNYVNSGKDSFGHGPLDAFSKLIFHEYAEAITDPEPAQSWFAGPDWHSTEIGDECNSDVGNTWLGGQYYAVQGLWSNQTGGCVLPPETACSTANIHWALQWTSSSSHSIYPGTQCPFYDAYHGWIGINSRMVTPSHFPQLVATGNHSVGAIAIAFGDGGWIRIGWLAGCINWPASPYLCSSNTALTLFDDEYRVTGCSTNCYTINSDGPLGYSASDIYEIYYLGSGSWRINKNYNVAVRTVAGFPGSGAMVVGSEVEGTFSPNSSVEMPYTTFGYSSPGTNSTLRIKGASGWVDWTPGINGHQTTRYDESTCPSVFCQWSPPYYMSVLNANYNLQAHG